MIAIFLFILMMQSLEAKALTFITLTCNNPVYLNIATCEHLQWDNPQYFLSLLDFSTSLSPTLSTDRHFHNSF